LSAIATTDTGRATDMGHWSGNRFDDSGRSPTVTTVVDVLTRDAGVDASLIPFIGQLKRRSDYPATNTSIKSQSGILHTIR
jgi:hypothetical protein